MVLREPCWVFGVFVIDGQSAWRGYVMTEVCRQSYPTRIRRASTIATR
jgi:hypothetical protein